MSEQESHWEKSVGRACPNYGDSDYFAQFFLCLNLRDFFGCNFCLFFVYLYLLFSICSLRRVTPRSLNARLFHQSLKNMTDRLTEDTIYEARESFTLNCRGGNTLSGEVLVFVVPNRPITLFYTLSLLSNCVIALFRHV